MGSWGCFFIGCYGGIFLMCIWLGWQKDPAVPIAVLFGVVSGSTGYVMGLGLKVIKEIFFNG